MLVSDLSRSQAASRYCAALATLALSPPGAASLHLDIVGLIIGLGPVLNALVYGITDQARRAADDTHLLSRFRVACQICGVLGDACDAQAAQAGDGAGRLLSGFCEGALVGVFGGVEDFLAVHAQLGDLLRACERGGGAGRGFAMAGQTAYRIGDQAGGIAQLVDGRLGNGLSFHAIGSRTCEEGSSARGGAGGSGGLGMRYTGAENGGGGAEGRRDSAEDFGGHASWGSWR